MRLPSRLAALLAAACLGLLAPGSLHAQKALVVCPPSDGAGCARIAEQLALTGDAGAPVFPGGVDRLYEELRTLSPAQLRSYAVVFVPSLADEPYALLREEAVRTRLRQVLTGRVAAWSGTPDRGAVEGAGAGKLELIRGLGRWAAAGWSEGRTGLVVLQDFSNPGGGARRYDWVEGVAGVEVRPDPGVRSYDEVEKNPASPAAEAVVGSLAYRNLASFGFAVPDSGAAQVAAWGRGRNGRGQAVLLTFRGEEAGGPGHPSAMSGAGSPTDVAIHGGQSQTGEVGTQLAQPLRVLVTDALGNGVPGETVTWTVTSGGGSLSAPTSTTDASGIAAIAWTLGTTAGTQTVAATRAGLTGSPVTFTAAASPGAPSAATSTITASPTTIPADGTSTSAITAQLKDAYGNNCTTGITSGGLSTTRGTIASVAYAGNGMYTATLTSSTSAGTATVIGILAGDTLASTATVTFTPGAAAQLAFAVQPSSTPAGTSISPAVQVTVRDAFGNTVTGATNPVTLAIGTNPAGGTLSGTTTVAAVNGVATFSNLGIDRAGTGYTLAASSGSLTGATSSTFNVTKAANTITVTPDSATLEVGATRQFTASVNDVAGNPIPSARVIWDSSDGTVIRVSGTGLVTALGTGFASVTATYEKSGDVRGGAVINVVATPATPRQYLVSTDTPDPAPGATITIRAQLADSLGAAVKTAGRTVTWSKTLPAGSFATPTSTTDTAGVARVAYAVSTTAGTMDSVTATDNAGLKGTSGPIRVQIGAAAVIRIIRGDTQTAKVSTPVPVQPTVQVVDASGNGVPNVTVTFAPVPGSGSVTGGTQTTSASGEATVGSWTLKATPGPGSLTVSAAGLTVTFTATALPGEPTDIAFQDGDNQTGVVGTALGQPLRVLVTDSLGNGVPGETVTWEVDAGSGSVSDPSSVTDLNGIASTTWTLGTVVDTQTVRARHDGINGSPVTFTAVATPTGASRLTITTQPSDSVQGGVNFPRQPVIRIQDPFGNAVSQAGVSVTAAIASGGGTLGGTTSVSTDASGAATFTSLAIGGIDGDRTLSFSATGLTPATSNTVSVAAGTPAQLGITTQPSSAAQAGSVFPQQPVVQLLDASGNPTGQAGVTVTAAVASGAGTLGGTVTAVTNALGTATFTDLSIGGTVGDRTLSFSATGLTPSTSNTTSVTAGNAAALAFSVQPSNTAAGAAITPAVQVTIRDAFGNTVTTATDNVTLAIGTNPSGGTLSGTTTVAAVNGLATFPNLSIDLAGAGYTLAASSGGLTGAASSAFDVAGGAPAQLAITTQPSDSAQSGTPFDRQPVVQLRDAFGNVVSQAGVSVTAYIASGGGTLGGTATVSTDAGGAAAFTNLSISGIDGDRTLSFSATGLTPATSSTVSVAAGTPAQLGITTQPSSAAQAGIAFAQQPVVQLLDASGNPTGQAGVTVTAAIASGAGTLGGTVTAVTNGLGVATFTDLFIGGTAGSRTLSFSSGALTPSTSGTISVTAGPAAAVAFTVPPSSAVASAPISPAVQVSIVDAFGNVVTGATDNVTVAVGNNPSGGTLSGTTTVPTVGGTATFSDLSIDLVGTGYTLSAGSGVLSGATSIGFNVVGGPLDHFLVEAAGGGPIGSQVVGTPFNVRVTAQDAFNNTVTSFTGTVGFTSTPSGGISAGGTSGAFTAGVLTSHAITFGPAGSFTLTATRTGGTESGTSNSFDVEAPPVAVNEGPASNSAPGQPFHAFFSTSGSPQTFNLAAPGVLSNDNLGFPPAAITSFGADSLGGPVTGHPAGSTVSPLPGHSTGSLSVGANGSTSFTPPDGFTGSYVFRYRITNASGTSDAQVTIAVGARPSAVNDTYSPVLVGNVPINTATSTGFRVTANDAGDGKVLAIVGQSGGTATLNADSTFRFRPNPGFEGAASFTYTVTNGFGTSAPATVSMTVATPVWFVSDTATTGGDGRFDSKFNALSSFAAVNNGTGSNPAANDRVFLYTGAYTGPLTLLSGQQLVGQGATGSSLGSVLGVAWPADSGPEPAVNGTSPTITSAAGGITLGSGNTLRGFNLGNVTGTALAGTSFGTVVVANVGINTTGQALSLTTGTLNGGFTQLRSTGGTNNVFLSGVATTGTSTLGGAGDVLQGATGDAFRVNGGTGSFTYSGNVTQAGNAAAVNVSGGHSGTLTFQTGTVSATSGTGLQFNNADGTYAFSGTSTLNGGNAGIDVTNGSSGTFTFSSGSSITNPTGETVVVSNSAPTFTYSGTLSKTGSGSGITLSSNTGGTLTFDGPTKVFSTGSATAVSLLNNNGATIVFADSLRITTTTGAGFSATGGGTVRVAGTHNSITSAGGIALNVSNTTIGTGGLNFRSISASGGSNGIVLSNTGSTAGLTVTGSGTAGSGGTIQNTTGADGTTSGIGVYLNNTRSVSLAWMQMNGHAGWAVRGSTVNGFTMDRTRITGSNGTDAGTSEGSVRFTGLTGSASITGSRIEGGAENNLEVVNSSGSLNRLTLTGDTIGLNSSALGADGVSLEATGGTLNVTIQNSVFTGARSRLFRMAMQAAAGGDLVFTGNTLSNGHGNPLSDAGAMDVTVGGGASLTYSVSGNTMRDSRGTALLLGKKFGGTPGNGTMSGTVANNAIGVAGVANSGSTGGAAIEVLVLGRGSHTTLIQNNQLRGYNSQGVLITAGGADEATTGLTHDAAMNVTLQGNTIAEPGNNAAVFTSRNGVMLNAGTNPGDDYPICLNLTGNTVNGSGADPGFLGTGQDYRLRQRQSTTVRLPGYTGAATDAGATLVSDLTGYLAPRTSGTFTLTASAQSTGFLNTAGGAPCATP